MGLVSLYPMEPWLCSDSRLGHSPPLAFGQASRERRTWRRRNTCNTWGIFRVWFRVGCLRRFRSFLRQVGELCDIHGCVLVLGIAAGEGGIHQEGRHPFSMVCFWPSSPHFLAPNLWSCESLKVSSRNHLSQQLMGLLQKLGFHVPGIQLHPATMAEYPNATGKPLKGF